MYYRRTITTLGGGPEYGGTIVPGEPLDAVEIARAALCEAGRLDLALDVHAYDDDRDIPAHDLLSSPPRHSDDHKLVLKAFSMAHEAVGHTVEVKTDDLVGWHITCSCGV
jgi:hypothetical protein